MRTADAIIIVTMLLLVVQPAWAENAADDVERFAVTWRDGSVSRAAEIPGWRARSGKRLEDLDITFKRPEINGRKLFNPENLARIVSDTTLQSKLTGPFIEFANGDILPGYIVPDLDVGASGVTVLISDPLFTSDWRKGVVRVRTDWIMRVVRSDSGPNAHVTAPGTVILRDKTRLVANAVTWRPGGLRLLLGSSVRTVPWTQIADFHAPGINRTAAVLRDASAGAASKTDFLCRMSVTNGAVLSYHSSRLQIRKRHRQCLQVVQPIWAMNAICVQPDQVVTESYRPVDELPLSLLNAEPLTQKSMTGFIWPWRRDCGLRGQRLSSGTIQADLGVAMHSHSEIAFDLPAGAKSFSSWVGIDRAVRKGGCVRCKIYRDKVSDKPLWGSGIMLGGGEPLRVDIADLKNAKRLVLVVEFAHRDRPAGADPLDIRDEVSWLHPTVRIDRSTLTQAPPKLTDLFGPLRGWTISPEMRKRITTRLFYDPRRLQWTPVMVLDAKQNRAGKFAPLILTREIDIDLSNAWLLTATGHDGAGRCGYSLNVHAGKTQINGTEGYNSATGGYGPGDMDTVAHCLGRFVGQKVTVTVSVRPENRGGALSGLLWGTLDFQPLITGYPQDAKTAAPDVELASLTPVKAGSGVSNSDVTLRHCRMSSGLVMSPGTRSVTHKLDRSWRRFVACVGPAGQSRGGAIGAFQVLVDGKVLWTSKSFARLSRAEYIDIPLPHGGKNITLTVRNESRSQAVWANAGFKLKGN